MREKTAAIVVNYNDSETTVAQLRRIRDYAALDAVIVVDNASTDHSLEALRAEEGGKVTVLAAEKTAVTARAIILAFAMRRRRAIPTR